MKRQQMERIITFAGLGIIVLVISLMAYLQLENARVEAYRQSYARIVADSRTLTQNYHSEIAKWKSKQYDNNTMISITDQYLPKFQSLIDRTKGYNLQQENISNLMTLL